MQNNREREERRFDVGFLHFFLQISLLGKRSRWERQGNRRLSAEKHFRVFVEVCFILRAIKRKREWSEHARAFQPLIFVSSSGCFC